MFLLFFLCDSSDRFLTWLPCCWDLEISDLLRVQLSGGGLSPKMEGKGICSGTSFQTRPCMVGRDSSQAATGMTCISN